MEAARNLILQELALQFFFFRPQLSHCMLNRDVNAAMIMAITRFSGAGDKLQIEWMTQGWHTSSPWLTDLVLRGGPFHYGGELAACVGARNKRWIKKYCI